MHRPVAPPFRLLGLLAVVSAVPLLIAASRVVQIPTGMLSEDDLRYLDAPVSHWLHALAGVTFDILGPLQFFRILRGKFGKLHRLAGRVFVLAGIGLSLSGISLLFQIESIATLHLDSFRGFAGLCLIVSLTLGTGAAISRDFVAHRAWMIRSYAIGIGSGTVAIVLFPMYILTGEPPKGLVSDVIVVGCWILTVLVGEWIIQKGGAARSPKVARKSLSNT